MVRTSCQKGHPPTEVDCIKWPMQGEAFHELRESLRGPPSECFAPTALLPWLLHCRGMDSPPCEGGAGGGHYPLWSPFVTGTTNVA